MKARAGPFGFAGGYGYQEDADSGLKLLGHRYYDSQHRPLPHKRPGQRRQELVWVLQE